MLATCDHLRGILLSELESGNSVEEVVRNAFKECDTLLMLKNPFTARHAISGSTVLEFTNTDLHYPLGKTFLCSLDKQGIFAPEGVRM